MFNRKLKQEVAMLQMEKQDLERRVADLEQRTRNLVIEWPSLTAHHSANFRRLLEMEKKVNEHATALSVLIPGGMP
jgi:23S rRNA maturation-related 3'-5' exoribonuclease YhaM